MPQRPVAQRVPARPSVSSSLPPQLLYSQRVSGEDGIRDVHKGKMEGGIGRTRQRPWGSHQGGHRWHFMTASVPLGLEGRPEQQPDPRRLSDFLPAKRSVCALGSRLRHSKGLASSPALPTTTEGRNSTLFSALCKLALRCSDDGLLTWAHTLNQEFSVPLPDSEVSNVIWASVCRYRARWRVQGHKQAWLWKQAARGKRGGLVSKGGGRPRKWASEAERLRAYRASHRTETSQYS